MDTPAIPPTPASPSAASAPPVPPAASAVGPAATIAIGDFQKLDLRIATVVECQVHPNADKLLVLQLELGNGERRQVCAGVRAYYAPEQLVGKQVVLVANLEPRQIRGQASQGMVLAAHDAASGQVVVLTPMAGVGAGSKVS
jgi:tRNA-binding protein